jgi:hypothetical protein
MIEATTEGAIDPRKLGIFVPYRAKADTSAYREMMQSQIYYLDQLAVIPIWGLHPDVLRNKDRCPQTGEDKTLLERLTEATHEAMESDGTIATSYSLGNIEKTRLTDTDGKWFVVTTKSAKNATCLLLDQVLIGQGNLTPEHQSHVARGAPYAQGIRRPVTKDNNIAEYSNYLGAAASLTGRQLILDYNFRIRDNSLRLTDTGPHQTTRPLEMLVAPLPNRWLESERTGALNGTITSSRMDNTMDISNENSAWQSIQTNLTRELAYKQQQLDEQKAEKEASLKASAAEKEALQAEIRLQAARQAEKLAEATRQHSKTMADHLKTFDDYKVEQAVTIAETQRIMRETNKQLEQLMALLMSGGTANMSAQNEPANRHVNRPRVSLEATDRDQQTAPAAATTEAPANTSDETVEEEKRAGKRHRVRKSPKKDIAPVPVSEAHLEDTTMESVEPTAERLASPGMFPRMLTAATNSMTAVTEPVMRRSGMEAAKRTNAKEQPSSLTRAASQQETAVPGIAKDNKANDSLDTVFDTTPPPKQGAESMDASLSEIDSESIEDVYTDEPSVSVTMHNISSIGNRDISTIAQDVESDGGWSDARSDTSIGCGLRQRKGKSNNRSASDISTLNYHDNIDYNCDPSQQHLYQNDMDSSSEDDGMPAAQGQQDNMDSSFEAESTEIALAYSGVAFGNPSTSHQEAMRRAKGTRKPQDDV